MFREINEIKTHEKNLYGNSNKPCSFNPDKTSNMKFDFSRKIEERLNPDKVSDMKFNFTKPDAIKSVEKDDALGRITKIEIDTDHPEAFNFKSVNVVYEAAKQK